MEYWFFNENVVVIKNPENSSYFFSKGNIFYKNGNIFTGHIEKFVPASGVTVTKEGELLYKRKWQNKRPSNGEKEEINSMFQDPKNNKILKITQTDKSGLGFGKIIHPDGRVYEGYIMNNEAHRRGQMKFTDGTTQIAKYEFDLLLNSKEKEAVDILPSGVILKGKFKSSKFEGKCYT